MYLEHFGLSAPPFQFTASPASLFMSRTHREGLAALEWGLLHEPSGLTLLIGDSGTGKTTLICALLARQHRAVHAAYLGNPKLSFPELLSSVMSQIGVRGGRSGKGAMLNAFQQYAAAMPLNERIAILVDEAQLLSEDAMEELRLLSNMECHGRKAAQIILAGQFELARRLASPAMRHFNERIGARAVLLALTPMECREYIEHRLRLCGSSSDRIFARGALDPLVRHSAGVPRRINALCHNSLLLAYSTESKRVSAAMVRQAAADYPVLEQSAAAAADEGSSAGRWRQLWRPLKPVLGLVLLGVAGFVSGEFLMSHGPVERRHGWLQRSSHTASAAAMPALDVNRKAPSAPAPLSDGAGPAQSPPAATLEHPAAPNPGSESVGARDQSGIDAGGPGEGVSVVSDSEGLKTASIDGSASDGDSPHADSQYVIVARGDTLGRIALRHLGSVTAVHLLMHLNPHITDASRVYPGEIVYLPASASTSEDRNTGDTGVE